jgi:phosphoglycolate phosphatase-like HAD superfamily hydrolase
MVEIICEGIEPPPEVIREVQEYIDRSTGILTIEQMEWLAEAARSHGWTSQVQTARAYKRIYNERLLRPVRARLARLRSGAARPEDLSVMGARRFVERLAERGITLYLVSGTDHEYVVDEANALGLAPFFGERIYGALDDTAAHTKDRIITRILEEQRLRGPELLVVGDGRVELQRAKERGALALGVASDEERGCGWNPRKVQRLTQAGADFIVPDFSQADELVEFLCEPAEM